MSVSQYSHSFDSDLQSGSSWAGTEEYIARRPHITLSGHLKTVNSIAWLPGGRIVTGSHDKTVRIWSLTNGMQEGPSMADYPLGRVLCIVATKDGRIISSVPKAIHPRVWNADTQELMDKLSPRDCNDPAGHMVLSHNEELLATCHLNCIVVWEMAETIRVRNYINYHSIFEEAKTRSVCSACFSPDGKRLAACFNDGTLFVFDVESGKPVLGPLAAKSSRGEFVVIVWSLDGSRIVCGCWKAPIHCLDARTGEIIGELWRGRHYSVRCLSLSPDGERVASGSHDGLVCFWDIKSGGPVARLFTHGKRIDVIAFSPSGEFVACSGDGGNISVWRVPWWNNADQEVPSLLDLSAVAPPDSPSSIPREPDLDFLDDPPLQDRQTENISTDPPHARRSVLSWRWWKKLPRLVLDRFNPIYMAGALIRVYVASRDSPRSRSQQVPSSPEHQADTTGETRTSSEDSSDSSDESSTDTPQDDPAVNQVGCCGLLPRRQQKAIAAQERHDVAVGPSPTTTPEISPPVLPSTRPTPQDIHELSAIVPSSSSDSP